MAPPMRRAPRAQLRAVTSATGRLAALCEDAELFSRMHACDFDSSARALRDVRRVRDLLGDGIGRLVLWPQAKRRLEHS